MMLYDVRAGAWEVQTLSDTHSCCMQLSAIYAEPARHQVLRRKSEEQQSTCKVQPGQRRCLAVQQAATGGQEGAC